MELGYIIGTAPSAQIRHNNQTVYSLKDSNPFFLKQVTQWRHHLQTLLSTKPPFVSKMAIPPKVWFERS